MSSDAVICVHGYFSHGAGMYLIKRRLEREYGMRVSLFNYPSVRGTLDQNATSLAAFIKDQNVGTAHIVGHSLGGVLALRMHANHPTFLPGRVVCLGSPLTGSRAANYLSELEWAEEILGHDCFRENVEDCQLPSDGSEQSKPVILSQPTCSLQ